MGSKHSYYTNYYYCLLFDIFNFTKKIKYLWPAMRDKKYQVQFTIHVESVYGFGVENYQ